MGGGVKYEKISKKPKKSREEEVRPCDREDAASQRSGNQMSLWLRPSLPIGGSAVGGGAGALSACGRLDVVGQVVGMLQEEVFEHAQLFAQQFDLGLQPLVLLLQLVDALLRVHRLLLAAHAALLHRQVVAFAALAILLAVLVCVGLLHLAGWEGLAASG